MTSRGFLPSSLVHLKLFEELRRFSALFPRWALQCSSLKPTSGQSYCFKDSQCFLTDLSSAITGTIPPSDVLYKKKFLSLQNVSLWLGFLLDFEFLFFQKIVRTCAIRVPPAVKLNFNRWTGKSLATEYPYITWRTKTTPMTSTATPSVWIYRCQLKAENVFYATLYK